MSFRPLVLLALLIAVSARADMPLPPMPGDTGAPQPPAMGSSAVGLPSMGASGSVDVQNAGKLIAQYQDELAKESAKVAALQDQLNGVKEHADDWVTKLDRAMRSTGLRFNGEAVVDSLNELYLPSSGVQRWWPTVGYVDLHLSGRPTQTVSADVIYRMDTLFGGFWGSMNVAGVRWFNVTADLPVGFSLGYFNYKDTPLTLWAPQDSYPYENPILARKRTQGMGELFLGDNSWPLQGGKVWTTLLAFNSLDVNLNMIGTRLGVGSFQNTGQTGFRFTYQYDQYLVGGHASVAPKDSDTFVLGGSYFELIEPHDSSTVNVTFVSPQSNNVASVDVSFKPMKDRLVVDGQYAHSNYIAYLNGVDPTYLAPLDWTTGNAARAHVGLNFGDQTLNASYISVDQTFINYAAQTRVEDTLGNSGPNILTSNNLWNPSKGDYLMGPYREPLVGSFSLTRYNNIIVADNQGVVTMPEANGHRVQGGGLYLTFDPTRNNTLPYGDATPNRQGGGLSYNGSFAKGLFQPSASFGTYSESSNAWYLTLQNVSMTRTYTRFDAGVKCDLKSMWPKHPLMLMAGYSSENTSSSLTVTALTSSAFDFGADWEFMKKFHLLGGYEQRTWSGSDFVNQGISAWPNSYVWGNFAGSINTFDCGLDWELSTITNLFLTYAYNAYADTTTSTSNVNDFGWQEVEGRVSIKF